MTQPENSPLATPRGAYDKITTAGQCIFTVPSPAPWLWDSLMFGGIFTEAVTLWTGSGCRLPVNHMRNVQYQLPEGHLQKVKDLSLSGSLNDTLVSSDLRGRHHAGCEGLWKRGQGASTQVHVGKTSKSSYPCNASFIWCWTFSSFSCVCMYHGACRQIKKFKLVFSFFFFFNASQLVSNNDREKHWMEG